MNFGERRSNRGAESPSRLAVHVLLFTAFCAFPLAAQVSVAPTTVEPAAWERFAIRVAGAGDSAVVKIRVDLPDAIAVLGIEPIPGWTFAHAMATDSTPATVTWTGGSLVGVEFREFALLARVAGDARRADLVFPVHITFAGGSEVRFAGPPGSPRAAPRVAIVGGSDLSAKGAFAMAGVAIALALVALGVAMRAVKQVRNE